MFILVDLQFSGLPPIKDIFARLAAVQGRIAADEALLGELQSQESSFVITGAFTGPDGDPNAWGIQRYVQSDDDFYLITLHDGTNGDPATDDLDSLRRAITQISTDLSNERKNEDALNQQVEALGKASKASFGLATKGGAS